jgi:hypothetical protein
MGKRWMPLSSLSHATAPEGVFSSKVGRSEPAVVTLAHQRTGGGTCHLVYFVHPVTERSLSVLGHRVARASFMFKFNEALEQNTRTESQGHNQL